MPKDLGKIASISAVALALFATPLAAQELDWDEDDDSIVSQDEFNTGFGEEGIFGGWDGDGDGFLSEDEFNAGIFGGYDADDSGAIEEPEFGDVGDDVGDGGLFDI